jgi:hypothetical protein
MVVSAHPYPEAPEQKPKVNTKPSTPERWQEALKRALEEGVRVNRVQSTGQWMATSGTKRNVAYELTVVNGIVHGCSCQAAEFNDPVCKHRARYYYDAGLLEAL